MRQRKKINLFKKRTHSVLDIFIAEKIVLYMTVAGVVLFFGFLVITGIAFFQRTKLKELTSRHEQLTNFISENKTNEAESTLFILKEGQFKKFYSEDARFLPYYKVLNDSMPTQSGSSSATIDNLLIDKTRKTNFTISFPDFFSTYNFLKHVESEKFLKNFESLKLNSFNLDQSAKGMSKKYQLSFDGKFIELN